MMTQSNDKHIHKLHINKQEKFIVRKLNIVIDKINKIIDIKCVINFCCLFKKNPNEKRKSIFNFEK